VAIYTYSDNYLRPSEGIFSGGQNLLKGLKSRLLQRWPSSKFICRFHTLNIVWCCYSSLLASGIIHSFKNLYSASSGKLLKGAPDSNTVKTQKEQF